MPAAARFILGSTQPLLDELLNQLPHGDAAQAGTSLEGSVEILGKINGSSHKRILMHLCIDVKSRHAPEPKKCPIPPLSPDKLP